MASHNVGFFGPVASRLGSKLPRSIRAGEARGAPLSTLPDAEGRYTSFYKALNAPYADSRSPPPPRPPRPHQSKCNAAVNWTERPPPDMDSSDEEDDDMDAPEILQDLGEQPLYRPVAHWAWTSGHALTNTVLLCNLHADAVCTTSLMRGTIDGTLVTYICKSWSRAMRHLWRGLPSELKLYEDPVYLRKLQGCIVPTVINVYDSPLAVSILTDLPHHSFWIEASADMPHVLKKAVIEAYVILHNRGILHGAAELHNMLIGGDGRVTLVNFHASLASKDMPEIGLPRADKSDFALELRQVMYKLDYEGARARENARMKRFLELEKRNKRRRARGDPEERPMLEELDERPPAPDVWKARWINGLDAPPRRYVVPGQKHDELVRCIDSFHAVIKTMEELDAADVTSPLIRYRPPPLPSSSRPHGGSEGPASSSLQNPRKRRMSNAAEDAEQPTKRARGEGNTDEAAFAPPKYERSSTTYDTGTSDTLLRAASTQNAKPQADSVRDFAYEPYSGPRGYYFPYPPSEALRDSMRVIQIRNANAIACGEQGLPYFRLDRGSLRPPAFKRALPRGMHVSLGALKRKRAAAENPLSPEERRQAKKRRFDEDRAAALAEDRAVRFDDRVSYRDPPHESDYEDEPEPGAPKKPRKRPLGPVGDPAKLGPSVLKPTVPVRTVSYNLALWLGTSDENDEAAPIPTSLLVRASRDPADEPDDDPPAQGDPPSDSEPGLPDDGILGYLNPTGSSSEIGDTSGTDRESMALSQPDLDLTSEDLATSINSTSPPAESMVRASDASAHSRDSRSKMQSRGGEGSRRGHAPSQDERDREEEMEVEAILLPRNGQPASGASPSP
ncbi:hypothetical protein BV20DRAFT_1011035 [Pilatotrama ljubarskyi]|nr:hypothetical protein BV20DRAFT_1011035 [Pilatotrama ljubarskyi]